MVDKNTFIQISDDCPVAQGSVPPLFRGNLSKAGIEYDLLAPNPYSIAQDDLNYAVYCQQQTQTGNDPISLDEYFSVGRPCLRASALVKRWGWGAHYDDQGRIALYATDSKEYAQFAGRNGVQDVLKGMRNKRA